MDAAATAGIEVVRRRSGGGAVLLDPGAVVWVDAIIPAGDPLWDADVQRATWWIGEAWAAAIDKVGAGPARSWRGGMRATAWSGRVCFAGLGPGEVCRGPQKMVGVSQRRTRGAALFQTAALLSWDPARLLGLLRLDDGERAQGAIELAPLAVGIGPQRAEALVEALVDGLTASPSLSPLAGVGGGSARPRGASAGRRRATARPAARGSPSGSPAGHRLACRPPARRWPDLPPPGAISAFGHGRRWHRPACRHRNPSDSWVRLPRLGASDTRLDRGIRNVRPETPDHTQFPQATGTLGVPFMPGGGTGSCRHPDSWGGPRWTRCGVPAGGDTPPPLCGAEIPSRGEHGRRGG